MRHLLTIATILAVTMYLAASLGHAAADTIESQKIRTEARFAALR